MISRRSLLTGLGASLIAAPVIVRAGSLMPVKTMLVEPLFEIDATVNVATGAALDLWATIYGLQRAIDVECKVVGNMMYADVEVETDDSLRGRIADMFGGGRATQKQVPRIEPTARHLL